MLALLIGWSSYVMQSSVMILSQEFHNIACEIRCQEYHQWQVLCQYELGPTIIIETCNS